MESTTTPWTLKQPDRDPNAWDIYAGTCKVVHMPWGSKVYADQIVACVNACEGLHPEGVPDLVEALEGVLEGVTINTSALMAARSALDKAKGYGRGRSGR